MIHEYGDEFLRPTNKAWQCPNCGIKLFTVSCIKSHKERCDKTKQEDTKQEDTTRQEQLKRALQEFKQKHNIRK